VCLESSWEGRESKSSVRMLLCGGGAMEEGRARRFTGCEQNAYKKKANL
jgi:hypothetical protein